MSGDRLMRWGVGAVGVLVGLYGALLLLTRSDGDQLTSAMVWLAAGVVAHDAVIALVAMVLVGLAVRLPPAAARAPAVVALVVLGPFTLIAVPFLGRFGAKDDNPTLLDRPYVPGFLVVVGLVALAVVVASVVRARQERPGTS